MHIVRALEDTTIIWGNLKNDSWIGAHGEAVHTVAIDAYIDRQRFVAAAAKVVNFRGVLAGAPSGGSTISGPLVDFSCGAYSQASTHDIRDHTLLLASSDRCTHSTLGGGSRGEESDRLPCRVLTFLPSLWTPNVFSTEFNHQTQLGPFTPDAD